MQFLSEKLFSENLFDPEQLIYLLNNNKHIDTWAAAFAGLNKTQTNSHF